MDPTLIPIFIVVFVGGGAIGFMLAWFLVGRQMTALTTRAATAEGKLIAAAQGAQGELRLRDTFASAPTWTPWSVPTTPNTPPGSQITPARSAPTSPI